jgi:hypothetical protein
LRSFVADQEALLDAILLFPGSSLPSGAIAWKSLEQLQEAVEAQDAATTMQPTIAKGLKERTKSRGKLMLKSYSTSLVPY